MSEYRYTVWHVLGIVIIAVSVAALSLGGGVFLGYQWGRANGLAAIAANRYAGAGQGETNRAGPNAFGLMPFQESLRGPYLGVEYEMLTQQLAQTEKLDVSEGALIRAVVAGGPADKAGLKVGDVIQKVNDNVVAIPADLRSLVRTHQAGDVLSLKVWRAGKSIDLSVTLSSASSVPGATLPSSSQPEG